MLTFTVSNQIIKRTDTFRPVAGSQNYLTAHFDFLTDDWCNLHKVAICRAAQSDTAHTLALDAEDNCSIPDILLASSEARYITVSIYGTGTDDHGRDVLITTNACAVFIAPSGSEDLI